MDLDEQIGRIHAQLGRVEARVDDFKDRIEANEKRLEALEEQVEQNESDVSRMNVDVEALEKELEQTKVDRKAYDDHFELYHWPIIKAITEGPPEEKPREGDERLDEYKKLAKEAIIEIERIKREPCPDCEEKDEKIKLLEEEIDAGAVFEDDANKRCEEKDEAVEEARDICQRVLYGEIHNWTNDENKLREAAQNWLDKHPKRPEGGE